LHESEKRVSCAGLKKILCQVVREKIFTHTKRGGKLIDVGKRGKFSVPRKGKVGAELVRGGGSLKYA